MVINLWGIVTMSYIIEQKIKGRIYLYEVTNFWDKEKKQSRQKRKYLGPKEKVYKKSQAQPLVEMEVKPSNFVSKSYGDIFLVEHIQKELGIAEILKSEFASNYKEMLALSAFMLQESSASYMFHYWHEEHHLEDIKKLNSQNLSNLYEFIGRSERERFNFLKKWGKNIAPTSGIYYDITSISSYSNNIEAVEWGYNRDKEALPQINIGLTHCSKTNLPLSYSVHPGSIVDVATLKNTIQTFDLFELRNLFFIMDRGFCSVSNIMQMHKNNMSFIQPLSFNLNKTKEIISKNKQKICKTENLFRYKDELLFHINDKIAFEEIEFDVHIFYNEKVALEYKHYLYNAIFDIEANIKQLKSLDNLEKSQQYLENNIHCKYKKYFCIENDTITRNNDEIEEAIFRAGSFVLLSHGQKLSNLQIIEAYRNRDCVEKDINSLKNHLDTSRIRAHNKDTANGRLFIKFIALITHSKIMDTIKNDPKLKKYSLNEIMAELKKLKINSFNQEKKFLTEISKKQKLIFKAFAIDLQKIIDGY